MTSYERDPNPSRATIGALLNGPNLLSEVLATIRPDQLADLLCERALTVMAELHRDGHPVTVTTVGLALGAETLPRLAAYADHAASPLAAEYHAQQALTEWQRWKVWQLGTRLCQQAEQGGDELLADALRQLETATDEAAAHDQPPATLEELLDEPEEPRRWVIPGLLERSDRLVWTGIEGLGKTTWLRQLAVCAASGVHPLTAAPSEPQRVLVVDCENSRRQDRLHYGRLYETVLRAGYAPESRLAIEIRPRGMDLTRDRDMAWLLRHAVRHRTDLLIIGPLYRLHSGDQNDERDARKLTVALDAVRERVGCAVVLEAHSPHTLGGLKQRTLRPAGSSLWMRWPEFGYGIRPLLEHDQEVPGHVEVSGWRGPRSERDWPDRLRHGGPGTMPWLPVGLPLRSVG